MAKVKEFFTNLVCATKTKIEDLVTSELDNESKKEALDTYVTNWATEKLKTSAFSVITKFIIQKYLIRNVGIITQIIFDLLKANITNLTKKEV